MSAAAGRADSMRKQAEWMVPSDDRILELIREYGNLTPQAIEDLGGPVAGHAGDRCRILTRYGLLDQLSRGLYRLTDKGRAYLDEDLDASTLDPNGDE